MKQKNKEATAELILGRKQENKSKHVVSQSLTSMETMATVINGDLNEGNHKQSINE